MDEKELLAKLREAFRMEARERLDSLADGLLEMETGLGKGLDSQSLEAIYREAHSLKGAARAVGLREIETICQHMESVLAALKRGEIDCSQALIDGIFRGLSAVEKRMADDPQAEPVSVVVEVFRGLLESKPMADSQTRPDLAPRPVPATPGATQAGERYRRAGGRSNAERDDPAHVTPSIAPTAAENAAGMPAQASKTTELAHSSETVRVAVQRLDLFLGRAEELITTKLSMIQQLRTLKDLQRRFTRVEKECSRGVGALRRISKRLIEENSGGDSPKKGFKDHLQAVQETIADRHQDIATLSTMLRTVISQVEEDSRQLSTIVDEIMEGAKEVLLQPWSLLLRGFPRMIKELARTLGKEAEVVIEGDQVEIDRRILEELKDPLVHLLRNAIDHGIEDPQTRRQRGKDPKGTIRIRVIRKDAKEIRLLVEDNGRGIDTAGIRRAAVAHGLMSEEEAGNLSEDAALELIFQSDLSTSSMVTDLSGRGLGMSIVKEKVEKVGGRIQVSSEKDRGTRVVIELPVSLTTFRGVLVEEQGGLFVIPSTHVSSVVRIDEGDGKLVEGRETITSAGTVIPLFRLGDTLGWNGNGSVVGHRLPRRTAVIVKVGDQQAAFEVDSVIAEQEILVKSLGPQLKKVHNIWGATVLGSGRVVPVLNPVDLARSGIGRQRPSAPGREAQPDAASGGDRPPSILVTDDSITSRTLLKNILESAGYDVTTSVDGREALTLLHQEEYDLLLSDIEMPRMDGFQLTRRIRQDPKLQDLPVILLTSLDSREDREKGIDAGADAYLVKNAFDQSNLLDVLKRFL